jgi:RNA polymerase sigma-70 factor (ECF subfamily)
VVARVSLNMLRSRTTRREEPVSGDEFARLTRTDTPDSEQEVALADSVGLALLVVLERLTPAERLAFVLHDMFALPFDEIAAIVGRSPAAARQLASRARRRVRGAAASPPRNLDQQRTVVNAFLEALRAGDVDGLVALLDPDLVVRADVSGAPGAPTEVRGATTWARAAVTYAKGARSARLVLVNGQVGVVVAPRGRLFRVLTFTMAGGRIARIDVIGDPAHLQALDLAVIE